MPPMSSRMCFAIAVLLPAGCGGPPPPAPPSPDAASVETPAPDGAPAAGDNVPATEASSAEAGPAAASAAAGPAGVAVAVYTEEQARRGQRAFRRVCSDCHYTSEFKGPVFTDAWARRTARDLYRELRRTMPDDNPGGLPRQTYVDVMAYILELNGYPAGVDELPPDDEILGSVRLTPPQGPAPGR